jgi:hypothetical protein
MSDLGCITQKLIADLCRTGTPDSPAAIIRQAAVRVRDEQPATSLVSATQIVALRASAYLRWLRPSPDTWRLLGEEATVGEGRVDLLWSDRDGRLLADELKMASNRRQVLDRDTRTQLARYTRDLHEATGDRYLGLRVITLSAPRRSLFVYTDEHYGPLDRSPFWFPTAATAPPPGIPEDLTRP